MYSVYQHWDPLEVCIVGKSYPPEFYSFIKNPKIRTVFEKIAEETEEDYQKLVRLLESFNVEVLRPNVGDDYKWYMMYDKDPVVIQPPPMTPRDYSIMLGDQFYFKHLDLKFNLNGNAIEQDEFNHEYISRYTWNDITNKIKSCGNQVLKQPDPSFQPMSAAMVSRIGKDIYVGTSGKHDMSATKKFYSDKYTEYRWHIVDTQGHSDGSFCPVKPGLIVSLHDIQNYQETFPGWEVVYLPDQSWSKVSQFLNLKNKNKGKWWVPGEELNDDFTYFVEQWMGHWVGYVEETVFDVNMLVIDEKNVVCNNYNKQAFDAFERHGITPHIINFRHRYFWDGGLHCITSDISRRGTMQNYFPERG
jgi:glycine amidinotransferase